MGDEAGLAVGHPNLLATEGVQPLGHEAGAHRIGDEDDVPRSGEVERHPDGVGREVAAVRDDLQDGIAARRAPQCDPDGAGTAVVHGGHAVEDVRNEGSVIPHPGVGTALPGQTEPVGGAFGVRAGVTDRGDGADLDEGLQHPVRDVPLGGDGHLHDRGDGPRLGDGLAEAGDEGGHPVGEHRGVLRPPALLRQEGALDVDAGQLSLRDEGAERTGPREEVVGSVGDHRGHERRRPVRPVEPGRRATRLHPRAHRVVLGPDLAQGRTELRTARPVAVQVHEAGGEEVPACLGPPLRGRGVAPLFRHLLPRTHPGDDVPGEHDRAVRGAAPIVDEVTDDETRFLGRHAHS